MAAVDLVANITCAPASELLSGIVDTIFELVVTANDVLIKKESFRELATYLEKVAPVLRELNKKDIGDSEILHGAIYILNREIKAAKQLTVECSERNKVYLLMNCMKIVKRLEDATREISRALGLLPLASLDLSSGIIEEIGKVCDSLKRAEFKAAIAEEEIMEKIESGIHDRNVDRSYANNLVILIAEAVGIPNERSALRKEFEEFKSEIENAYLRKDQAEAIQMAQISALLERADATTSPMEKEVKYLTKRNSLGNQPLEPLLSFYCPISSNVMADPVETSSGQTFERSAIEKWFADGNNFCPISMTPLNTSILRPNKSLQQSIVEWEERNTMITIVSMKSKLLSEEEEEVLHCLGQLHDLCEQREMNCEWVILENYIPILIKFLGSRNRDIRSRALLTLGILALDSDDAKERITRIENAIESIAHSLGRPIYEGKLAVALLLELSKCILARQCIGKARGCILLLVTMSSSDDGQAARQAEELLHNLSFSDQNVMQMAKANYFKYLLQRLSSGPEEVKMIMATTVAEMELTDHNKASLYEGGVLGPLLHLVSHGDIHIQEVAVKALQNVSKLPKNGLQMIREGAAVPLLELLFHCSSASSNLREDVAVTIMHLAISAVSQESGSEEVSLLDSDDKILMLFSLISLNGPGLQQSILRTFNALCHSPSSANIKSKLLQSGPYVEVLVQLCELDNSNVRANAVKLLSCLIEGGNGATVLGHIGQKNIETLLRIIKSSDDGEEIAAAVGIISNLPQDPQITQWLLDAGALPIIYSLLSHRKKHDVHERLLTENAAAAVCQFASSSSQASQKKAAEAGIIPALVRLLESGSTPLTKKHAAISLARFSESSSLLSRPVPKSKGIWCFSVPREIACVVHRGSCTIESSFCLVEANAVGPLVKVLAEADPEASEAAVDALLTLIQGVKLQNGSKVLEEANTMPLLIRLVSSPSPRLQEKALNALERIFRVMELKQKYGPSAQMPLVDLTMRGSNGTKSLAARILGHLNVLQDQSSFF